MTTRTVAIRVFKSKITLRWNVAFEGTHLATFDTHREAFDHAYHIATFNGSVR